MSDFQYFVPGRRQLKLDDARALGLGYAFDANPAPCPVTDGPGRGGGVVLCRSTERIGYFPQRQTWSPMAGNPDVWVGLWNDDRPTPEQVAREPQVSGLWLELADGHRWLVPKAREYFEHEGELLMVHTLPLTYRVDEQGELVRDRIKPKYQSLWDAATSYLDAALHAEQLGQSEWTHHSNIEIVARAFEANYYVSTTELALLGVWDDEMRDAVRDVVVDMARLIEFAKKKAVASPSTDVVNTSPSSAGRGPSSTASRQPIGQLSPTGKDSNGGATMPPDDAEVNCG